MSEQPPLFPDANYAAFLNGLKTRIRSAQVKAALAVNQELILLYWQIGPIFSPGSKRKDGEPRSLIG